MLGPMSRVAAPRPRFISQQITTGASVSSLNATAPVTIRENNLLFAVITLQSGSTVTMTASPTGWTILNPSPNRWVCYKKATNSEPASYTFTFSASVTNISIGILNYSNAKIDVIGTVSGTATNPTATGITVSRNKAIAILALTVNTSGTTVTDPIGWNNRIRRVTTSSLLLYDKWVEAGATGNVAVTSSNSASRAQLFSIIFN